MKHIFETKEIHGWKRLIDAEIDAGAEFDAME
jgi:hypothetical protein